MAAGLVASLPAWWAPAGAGCLGPAAGLVASLPARWAPARAGRPRPAAGLVASQLLVTLLVPALSPSPWGLVLLLLLARAASVALALLPLLLLLVMLPLGGPRLGPLLGCPLGHHIGLVAQAFRPAPPRLRLAPLGLSPGPCRCPAPGLAAVAVAVAVPPALGFFPPFLQLFQPSLSRLVSLVIHYVAAAALPWPLAATAALRQLAGLTLVRATALFALPLCRASKK